MSLMVVELALCVLDSIVAEVEHSASLATKMWTAAMRNFIIRIPL